MEVYKQQIACIVLPPGHGKSFYHCKIPGLIEADSVFNCRGDDILTRMRKVARETRNWIGYDVQWTQRILTRLTGHPWVIMIPSKDLCGPLKGVLLGCYQLDDEQWAENLKPRGKTVTDYDYARCTGDDVIHCMTNSDLETQIFDITNKWMRPKN